MKNLFLLLYAFSMSYQTYAQITIERSDYTRAIGETVVTSEASVDVLIPTAGANQVWNYANLQIDSETSAVIEAGTNPAYPTANISRTTSSLIFNFLTQEETYYESLNEDNYVVLGRVTSPASDALTPFTGNDQDTLTLLGNTTIYEEPDNVYQFPINFGDSFASNYTIDNDFVLTVNAFGVDHVPGQRIFHVTETHDVIGYGTLIVPNPDGMGTVSVDALLMKQERILVDSLFLGGAPGPPELIASFGLEQGGVISSVNYTFVAKGLPRSAMFIGTANGVVTRTRIATDLATVGNPLNDVFTIERSDYTREVGGEVDRISLSVNGLTIPTQGAGPQVWDYSALEIENSFTRTFPAGTHPDLPEANIAFTTTQGFLNLIEQDVTFYESLNDDYYGTLGRSVSSSTASITPITGGVNDTFSLIAAFDKYAEPVYRYQFPIQYGDSYGYNVATNTGYEMTVESFGLDRVPGNRRIDFQVERTVVAYGTLLLPNPNPEGNEPLAIEALLIKEISMTTDSIFLAGQPGPDALIAAFGLEQGRMLISKGYIFVAKGLSNAALSFTEFDGTFSNVIMSGDVVDVVNTNREIAPHLLAIQTFPNPSTGNFQVSFNKTDAQSWTFSLYNPLGQLVQKQSIHSAAGATTVEVGMGSLLPQTGTYFYTITDAAGTVVGVEKVMIR